MPNSVFVANSDGTPNLRPILVAVRPLRVGEKTTIALDDDDFRLEFVAPIGNVKVRDVCGETSPGTWSLYRNPDDCLDTGKAFPNNQAAQG